MFTLMQSNMHWIKLIRIHSFHTMDTESEFNYRLHKLPYIANHSRWEIFTVFADQLVTAKLFQWNSLCNRVWSFKTTIRPRMFSSKLQFSFATANLFHLERFVKYGILCGCVVIIMKVYLKDLCFYFNCLRIWVVISQVLH